MKLLKLNRTSGIKADCVSSIFPVWDLPGWTGRRSVQKGLSRSGRLRVSQLPAVMDSYIYHWWAVTSGRLDVFTAPCPPRDPDPAGQTVGKIDVLDLGIGAMLSKVRDYKL